MTCFLSEVGDWEEEASVAILGSYFSLGSGAATANANAEQAKSRGRNDSRSMGVHSRRGDGVVARPRAVGRAGISASGGGDRTRASGGGGAVIHSNQDRPPV